MTPVQNDYEAYSTIVQPLARRPVNLNTAPPDVQELQPELPDGLAAVINRCLFKDPAQRFQSAREILDADHHDDGESDTSREDYLKKAFQFGVWKKHDRIAIPRADVKSIRRLGDPVSG